MSIPCPGPWSPVERGRWCFLKQLCPEWNLILLRRPHLPFHVYWQLEICGPWHSSACLFILLKRANHAHIMSLLKTVLVLSHQPFCLVNHLPLSPCIIAKADKPKVALSWWNRYFSGSLASKGIRIQQIVNQTKKAAGLPGSPRKENANSLAFWDHNPRVDTQAMAMFEHKKL